MKAPTVSEQYSDMEISAADLGLPSAPKLNLKLDKNDAFNYDFKRQPDAEAPLFEEVEQIRNASAQDRPAAIKDALSEVARKDRQMDFEGAATLWAQVYATAKSDPSARDAILQAGEQAGVLRQRSRLMGGAGGSSSRSQDPRKLLFRPSEPILDEHGRHIGGGTGNVAHPITSTPHFKFAKERLNNPQKMPSSARVYEAYQAWEGAVHRNNNHHNSGRYAKNIDQWKRNFDSRSHPVRVHSTGHGGGGRPAVTDGAHRGAFAAASGQEVHMQQQAQPPGWPNVERVTPMQPKSSRSKSHRTSRRTHGKTGGPRLIDKRNPPRSSRTKPTSDPMDIG